MCVGVSMDSVFDVDNESIPIEKRNGFSFQSLDEGVSKKNISSFFSCCVTFMCHVYVSEMARTIPTCPSQARFLTGQTVAKGLKWLLRGGVYNVYAMVSSLLLKLFSVQGLNWALDRAMSYYAQNPDWWEKLVRKAMKIDFSWDVSADQYVDFYNQIVTNVHATRT